jgi:hypothetical protein
VSKPSNKRKTQFPITFHPKNDAHSSPSQNMINFGNCPRRGSLKTQKKTCFPPFLGREYRPDTLQIALRNYKGFMVTMIITLAKSKVLCVEENNLDVGFDSLKNIGSKGNFSIELYLSLCVTM